MGEANVLERRSEKIGEEEQQQLTPGVVDRRFVIVRTATLIICGYSEFPLVRNGNGRVPSISRDYPPRS